MASVISKLFEHFILPKIRSYLVTVDNQFGFKERHNSDMCVLFLLKQLISHYTQHGSLVFAIFLDASKTFDKVNHSLLFEKMIKHKVPMIFIRLVVVGFFIFNHKITPSSTQKTAGLKMRKQRQNDIR